MGVDQGWEWRGHDNGAVEDGGGEKRGVRKRELVSYGLENFKLFQFQMIVNGSIYFKDQHTLK